jgi:biotin operon repressor
MNPFRLKAPLSWEEHKLVRDSDLYEGQGLAKPLLCLIALLIIDIADDPDRGFCIASQDYLAAALGCSHDKVSKLVRLFERDGWLKVERTRNKYGRKRNRYALLPRDEIARRRMKKDAEGHYIRAKFPGKVRRTKRLATGRFTATQAASSREAKRLVAVKEVEVEVEEEMG